MSSQYVKYKGRGFKAKEPGIEIWLAALSREIADDKLAPHWLKELGDYWREEIVAGYGGLSPALEEQLEDRPNIDGLIAVCDRALGRLVAMQAEGQATVSVETFEVWPQHASAGDGFCDLAYVVEVARAFAALLDGSIGPDDSPYPFVAREGLVRHPQQPKGPPAAHGDRTAQLRMQIPLANVEEASAVLARLFGITWTKRESPSESGEASFAVQGDEKFSLLVNREPGNWWHDRRYPAGALVLEIQTTVSRASDYERRARSHFGPALGRVRKTYV
jgi:hypothetical protein